MPRRRTFTPGRINQKRSRKATSTFANSVMGVGTDIKSLPTDRLMAQEREDNPVFHSQRKLGGSIGGTPIPVGPSPLFYWKGQNTLAATTGTDPAFTRATAATFEDFEGLIKTVESSEPRFQGARRVENVIANSTSLAPLLQNGATLVSSTETAPNGEPVAYSYSLPSTGTPRVLLFSSTQPTGGVYTDSVWLRSDVAGTISITDASQNQYIEQVSVTTEWQRFSSPLGWTYIASNWLGVARYGGDTLTKVYIAFPQRENVTGQTNKNPSEYVATGLSAPYHGANVDGVQYFKTLNANTVTGNVVTEAVGSPLTRANTQFGELHGVAGDYFSTPNVVTTWGELDLRARAQIDSFPNGYSFLADKENAFFLAVELIGATQKMTLRLGVFGASFTDTSSVAFPTSQLGIRNWYRVTYDAATGDVKFFTADGNLEAPAINDYVQLGATQNIGMVSVPVSTDSFLAGEFGQSLTTYPFDGDIYRSQIFNEIDGTTPVVDFTAGSYVSGSTLVSSTSGETWTLNGNASVFQPPVDASGPFGYLAEKASTNLFPSSNSLSTATRITVTLNNTVAPNGGINGTLLSNQASGTPSLSYCYYHSVMPITQNTQYTLSCYAKYKAGSGFVWLLCEVSSDAFVMFDILNGVAVNLGTGGQQVSSSRIEDAGNGWYRISATFTKTSAGTSDSLGIGVSPTSTVPNWNTTGLADTQQAYVYGFQLETSSYPTSYIPTTTTAVLRNADVLIAGDMVTDAAGSGYAEASSIWATAASSYILVRNSTGRLLWGSGSTQARAYNGTTSPASAYGLSYQNRPAPMASTWGNDFTVYKDGAAGAALSYNGTMASGNLGIGNDQAGSGQWDGTIREVKIFDSELTAAEVSDL